MSRRVKIIAGTLLLAVSACTTANSDGAPTSDLGTDDFATAETATTSTGQLAPSSTAMTSTTLTTSTGAPQQVETEPTIICDEVSCNSALTIELDEVDIEPNDTYHLEICVDGDCTAATITVDIVNPGTQQVSHGATERRPGTLERHIVMWADDDRIDYVLPEKEYGQSVAVAFTLEDADRLTLVETGEATDVPVERSQPSGPGCPVCFFGRLTV